MDAIRFALYTIGVSLKKAFQKEGVERKMKLRMQNLFMKLTPSKKEYAQNVRPNLTLIY